MLPGFVRPKNRVELETEILCAALRQSWTNADAGGVSKSSSQLNHLFPDLVPASKPTRPVVDYYGTLGLKPHASANDITSSFLSAVRSMFRSQKTDFSRWPEYHQVLDAGFVLRKPRLRLSHDLLSAAQWLQDAGAVLRDEGKCASAAPSMPPQKAAVEAKASENKLAGSEKGAPDTQAPQEHPAPKEHLPDLVRFMQEASVIGAAEVKALTAQLALAPEIPSEQLITASGYATPQEMKSIWLGQTLIAQGKITMAQFQVTFYDERNFGVRMAESLQLRGWLSAESG